MFYFYFLMLQELNCKNKVTVEDVTSTNLSTDMNLKIRWIYSISVKLNGFLFPLQIIFVIEAVYSGCFLLYIQWKSSLVEL